ncbi:MAG: hypothetical protein R3313_01790 [Candidatus Saccharimonadales bacterium]|nr:hypothetical protein [Candidatus Saccharimonadales bacterium]
MALHIPVDFVGPTSVMAATNPLLIGEDLPGGEGPLWGVSPFGSLQPWAPYHWKEAQNIKGMVFQVWGDKDGGKSTLGMSLPYRVFTYFHRVEDDGTVIIPIIRMYNMRRNEDVPELLGVTEAMGGRFYELKGKALNIFDDGMGLDEERIRELFRELLEAHGREPLDDHVIEVFNIAIESMLIDAKKREVRPSIDDLVGFVSKVNKAQQTRYLTNLTGYTVESPDTEDELRRYAAEATKKLGNFIAANGSLFGGTGSMKALFEEPMLTWDFSQLTIPQLVLVYKATNTWQRNAIDNSITAMSPTFIVVDEAWQLRRVPEFNEEDLRLRKLIRAKDIVYLNISHRMGDAETGSDADTADYARAMGAMEEVDCHILFRMERDKDHRVLLDDLHLFPEEVKVISKLNTGECYVVMSKKRFRLQGFLTTAEKAFSDTNKAVRRVLGTA